MSATSNPIKVLVPKLFDKEGNTKRPHIMYYKKMITNILQKSVIKELSDAVTLNPEYVDISIFVGSQLINIEIDVIPNHRLVGRIVIAMRATYCNVTTIGTLPGPAGYNEAEGLNYDDVPIEIIKALGIMKTYIASYQDKS